nr:reverse transcriptase [Tanacetum cinerariifolium]
MMKEEQIDIPSKGWRLMLGCLKNIEHVSIFYPASNLWIFDRKFVCALLYVCLRFHLERKGYRLILTDMYLDYRCRVYVDESGKLEKNDEAGLTLLEVRPSDCEFHKVRDLMVDDGSAWDVSRTHMIFPTEIVKRILSIHIAAHRSDILFWEGIVHGNFLVRDAYMKGLENIGLINNLSDIDTQICSSLWKATIPM